MSEPIPVGTLVRVLPECMQPGGDFYEHNLIATSNHGWLYFVVVNEGVRPDDLIRTDPYLCRSLATGQTDIAWLPREIEEAPTDE